MFNEPILENSRFFHLIGLYAVNVVRPLFLQAVDKDAQRDLKLGSGGGRASPGRSARISLGEEQLH